MKLYKLTDAKGWTRKKEYNAVCWEAGFKLELPAISNPQLCTSNVVHAYINPNLALLLNPIHAGINKPMLWLAEGEPCVTSWDKVGCFAITTVKKLKLPAWYVDEAIRQKVQMQFAILCAEAVLHIYETAYPENNTSRKAIETASAYLQNPTKENAEAARAAARTAARTAAVTANLRQHTVKS